MTPEKLHLAINHIPIVGLACALVPLLIGLVWKHKLTLLAGLLIAAICAGSIPLVMDSGERAYERYKNGPINEYLDPDGIAALEAHYERAETWSKVTYITALLAVIGLVLLVWRPHLVRWAAVAVLIGCLISVVAGIWIADVGGKIRRPDFRSAIDKIPTQIEHSSTPFV